MAKLVLIDPSLRDSGGHYYEYAIRVLSSADRAGFETVLATHRDFPSGKIRPWRELPIFRHSFWTHYQAPQPAPPRSLLDRGIDRLPWPLSRIRSAPRYLHQLVRVHFRFSRLNLAVMVAIDGRPCGVVPLSRLTLSSARRLLALYRWSRRAARLAAPALNRVRQAAAVAAALAAAPAALAIGAVLAGLAVVGLVRGRPAVANDGGSFGADLTTLGRDVAIARGDHVFLPTSHIVELEGIVAACQRVPAMAAATWHVLFRHDLFKGPPGTCPGELEAHRPLRNALRRAACLADLRVYTDTELLTDQYDALGVLPFRTFPIPSAALPDRPAAAGRKPLVVAYLGDAREEKGFQHLPRLVADLHDEYLAVGRVRFTIQSNFNVPGGEPACALAKTRLQDFDPAAVKLIDGPFPPAAYGALLNATDILLLPYDPGRYFARSSGIFVEAMGQGIPAVIPGGTWMAYAVQDSSQACLARLIERRATQVAAERVDTLAGLVRPRPPAASHAALVLAMDRAAPLPRGSLVELGCGEALAGGCETQVTVRTLAAAPRLIAVFRLRPDTAQLRFSATLAARDQAIVSDGCELIFLNWPEDPPLGAAVAVFGPEPGGFAGAVREVVDHYPAYRRSAAELAVDWRSVHCPDRMVEQLVGGVAETACRHTPAPERSRRLG
ncbi:MAG: hypothetical protein GC191_17085 [Azospirillum sp.]|nr:hypothetical protein [Azospirillum sp.]